MLRRFPSGATNNKGGWFVRHRLGDGSGKHPQLPDFEPSVAEEDIESD